MSFLNPVNEPVLRFSSTDASAPQLNYNTRVAGDVKAILKACLVTGYGAKASAGWTITTDTLNIGVFLSPSVAMSDYKLGIDDRNAATSTWYYTYKNIRTNPVSNIVTRQTDNYDRASARNGWQLLVTKRGIFFIEIFDNNVINELVSRVTYWGQIKSGLKNNSGANVAFFNIGHGSNAAVPVYFFDPASNAYRHFRINSYLNDIRFCGTNISSMSSYEDSVDSNAAVEVVSALYIYNLTRFVGEQPALLMKDNNDPLKRYGVFDEVFQTRPVISLCLSYDYPDPSIYPIYSRTILLYLDYWEY